jgi:hypothetical protein
MDEHLSSVIFKNTSILARKSRPIVWLVRKALEIELHPSNVSQEVAFCTGAGSLQSVNCKKEGSRHSSRT